MNEDSRSLHVVVAPVLSRLSASVGASALALVLGCAARPQPDIMVLQTITQPPSLLSQSGPQYPELARKLGIEGDVLVAMIVDTTGYVSEVEVLRGPAMFHDAARAAARSSVFMAARADGGPIPYRVVQRFSFQLEGSGEAPPALPLWEADVKPILRNEEVLVSPREAFPAEAQGDVFVEAVIEPNGAVSRVTLLTGSLVVFEAARSVIYRLRYVPAKRGETPARVAALMRVTTGPAGVELDVRNRDAPLYNYWEVDVRPVFLGQETFTYVSQAEGEARTGEVSIGMIIDTAGATEAVWILRGSVSLREPALRIARGFRCIPARHKGHLVRVWVARRMNFTSEQWPAGNPG